MGQFEAMRTQSCGIEIFNYGNLQESILTRNATSLCYNLAWPSHVWYLNSAELQWSVISTVNSVCFEETFGCGVITVFWLERAPSDSHVLEGPDVWFASPLALPSSTHLHIRVLTWKEDPTLVLLILCYPVHSLRVRDRWIASVLYLILVLRWSQEPVQGMRRLTKLYNQVALSWTCIIWRLRCSFSWDVFNPHY
jgi:hypothetical protein